MEAEEEDNGLLTSMDSFVRLRVMLDANLWAFHQARVRRRNTEKILRKRSALKEAV